MHLLMLIYGIVLLPKAYTLKCYECVISSSGACRDIKQCPMQEHQCSSVQMTIYNGGSKTVDISGKSCSLPSECGEFSVNFGISRTGIISRCCNADLCNTFPVTDPGHSGFNGKMCYTCEGNNCSVPLRCQGSEDHCVTATVQAGDVQTKVKGCISKLLCSHTDKLSGPIAADMTCCQGKLCNGGSSSSSSSLTGLLVLVAPLVWLWSFH
ncbi:urokinase plasminogen activator surface receptor-like [Aulostomus maculatus]